MRVNMRMDIIIGIEKQENSVVTKTIMEEGK